MTVFVTERESGTGNGVRVTCRECGGRVVCDVRMVSLIRSYLERRHECPEF